MFFLVVKNGERLPDNEKVKVASPNLLKKRSYSRSIRKPTKKRRHKFTTRKDNEKDQSPETNEENNQSNQENANPNEENSQSNQENPKPNEENSQSNQETAKSNGDDSNSLSNNNNDQQIESESQNTTLATKSPPVPDTNKEKEKLPNNHTQPNCKKNQESTNPANYDCTNINPTSTDVPTPKNTDSTNIQPEETNLPPNQQSSNASTNQPRGQDTQGNGDKSLSNQKSKAGPSMDSTNKSKTKCKNQSSS